MAVWVPTQLTMAQREERRRAAAQPVVRRAFGVSYHPRYLERPLKAHGFTPHRPSTQARERDEYVIAHWPTRDWVALKEGRAERAAPLSSWTRRATPSGLVREQRGRDADRRPSSAA
jgi:hypothetical protein